MTAMTQVEARDRFLLSLDEAVRPLTVPEEIMAVSARLLGEHLDVDRCAYADIEADGDSFERTAAYTRDTAALPGRARLSDYGPEIGARLQENVPYILNDDDPDAERLEPF